MNNFDIAFCLDDKYVPMCGVAMESLCQNNEDLLIHFHIISSTLDQIGKDDLREIALKHGKKIEFYHADEDSLSNCIVRENEHITIATYLRILIPSIIPESIKRVLYLDCDLVVCGNIIELFDTDLTNWACGAIPDCSTDDMRTYNRLNYNRDDGYFNAGVLLMNLDYWREHNITNKILKYISENQNKLKFHDQDAINAVLHGKIRKLPFVYNMMDPFYTKDLNIRQEYLNEISRCLNKPKILHFATSAKPWLREDSPHPLKEYFYDYLSQTKWKGVYPLKQSILGRIKTKIRRLIENILKIRPEFQYLSKSEIS